MKQLLIIVSIFSALSCQAQRFSPNCKHVYEINKELVDKAKSTIMPTIDAVRQMVTNSEPVIDSIVGQNVALMDKVDTMKCRAKRCRAEADSIFSKMQVEKNKNKQARLHKTHQMYIDSAATCDELGAQALNHRNENCDRYWPLQQYYRGGKNLLRYYLAAVVKDMDEAIYSLCPDGQFTFEGKVICTKWDLSEDVMPQLKRIEF